MADSRGSRALRKIRASKPGDSATELLTPELRRWPMLSAWYELLNADEAFTARMRDLDAHIGEIVRTIRPLVALPAELEQRLRTFARVSNIPEDRWFDVLFALVDRGPLAWSGASEMVPDATPIKPPAVAVFDYDPTRADRADVRRWAQAEGIRVERAILAQADAAALSAAKIGFRPRGPHRRSARSLRLAAKRVFRRVVLGWSYMKIARQEHLQGDSMASSEAVARAVQTAAAELGVPIPHDS